MSMVVVANGCDSLGRGSGRVGMGEVEEVVIIIVIPEHECSNVIVIMF